MKEVVIIKSLEDLVTEPNEGIIYVNKDETITHEINNRKEISLSEPLYYWLQLLSRVAGAKGYGERFKNLMYETQKSSILESKKSKGKAISAFAWRYDKSTRTISLEGVASTDSRFLIRLNCEFDNLVRRLGAERAITTTWLPQHIMQRGKWRYYEKPNRIKDLLLPGRGIYIKEYDENTIHASQI